MMMLSTMWLALAASTLGACKWTEFDDIQSSTWVDSTQKPNVKSTDYGIAVQRGVRSGGGGRLVVIGAGEASYSELVYSAKGEASFPATAIGLKELYGIPNISQQPVLLADPSSDDISLIVGSDNGIVVLTGTMGTLKLYQLFNQAQPDAGTYMLAPDTAPVPQPRPQPLPLVAVGENVLGALLPALPNNVMQPTCKLTDTPTAGFKAQVRALGVVRTTPMTTDDVLVWDAGGKLYRYPSDVFNGCTTRDPLGSVDTTFKPDQGAQILSIDATHVLLQGHSGDAGYLQVFAFDPLNVNKNPAPVGAANMVAKIRTAALLVAGPTTFVAAGIPTALVGGTTAGQVVLFKVSTTATGVASAPSATFNDAQPESNQSFGRGVAAMPFNGKQVLAVAADNEIFVYFRANLTDGTALYDETRQGP
jgi:hypothetical protein